MESAQGQKKNNVGSKKYVSRFADYVASHPTARILFNKTLSTRTLLSVPVCECMSVFVKKLLNKILFVWACVHITKGMNGKALGNVPCFWFGK